MATPRPAAGLIYGPSSHHLDHLAPLCQIIGIPLLCTDSEIADRAKRFYPEVEVILKDYLTIGEYLVSTYDIIFYSIPRALFDEVFFFAQKFKQKKVHTIWCPHGNSDKGANTVFMEALGQEEIALVYGQKMIDFLHEKNVFANLKKHVITGNYRHEFYLKNQEFYDNLVFQEIFRHCPKAEKTLLYAPTWQDSEQSSSFYQATPHLVKALPPKWNLLIKPHPNLRLQDEIAFDRLCESHADNPRVIFLNDFPVIYPLLNAIDVYIGDMSSIGYDFLTFDRPLFFLNQNARNPNSDKGLFLYQCGTSILPEQYPHIHQIIRDVETFEVRDYSTIRKKVYDYTFGPSKKLAQVKEEILACYLQFPDSDWSYY